MPGCWWWRGPDGLGAIPVARELALVTVGQPAHIYLTNRDPNVGGGLLPMAASGPTRMLDQTEYISVIQVTAAIGSALTAAHF
ncbi:hypothetical protein E3O56_03780 [Pseudomonas sp. W2Aug9]|uniref:Uncharacterized protein n=1 Tax=Pseudomonas synxantha TaxID=47883 RepID=A0A5D3G8N1_9PSED|nr:hypothetical protein [Pseudomonas sp. W2Aug9]MCK3830394.1 hypothetical protein [Pseudomonas fluorescens]TYK56666.1 hypothetical protein FXO26_16665 [Pseudomonas synxantha]